MRAIKVKGVKFTAISFTPCTITVRVETSPTKKGKFTTVSFADEKSGVMLQIPLTPAVKELLRGR